MSELMQELREIKPECQLCINAIRYRAELVAYQAETSASTEMLKGIYKRGLRCSGLVSLTANSTEWQQERMLRDETSELKGAQLRSVIDLNFALRTAPDEPMLIEIPTPEKVAYVTRLKEHCMMEYPSA